jgi:hypothetical protein
LFWQPFSCPFLVEHKNMTPDIAVAAAAAVVALVVVVAVEDKRGPLSG